MNEVVDLIGELYAVDRLCPTGPPGDDLRRRLRGERSRQVVERIRAWAISAKMRTLPESGLAKAIDYMLGMWRGLVRFLDDPRIPLDNNGTERGLRIAPDRGRAALPPEDGKHRRVDRDMRPEAAR